MVVENQNERRVAKVIELFKRHGSLLVDSCITSSEIGLEVGTLEEMRAAAKGPSYVKFGDKSNAPVRYRIDHLVNLKYGFNEQNEAEYKKLLKQVLRSSDIEAYSLKETAKLYGFEAQKLRRDIKEEAERVKVEQVNLVAPKYNRLGGMPKSRYQFYLDDIVAHICKLRYMQTL